MAKVTFSKNNLAVADAIISCSLLLFLMVAYWRGIWDLVGVYILPDSEPTNHWVRSGIGACSFIGYLILPFVKKTLSKVNKCLYILGTRVFMYIYGGLYMTMWRGVWDGSDYYMTKDWKWSGLCLGVCYIFLICARGFRTTTFPPMAVCVDTRNDLLVANTRFHIDPDVCYWKYVLDSLFTHFGIAFVTIVAWRSIWNVADGLIYPDDFIYSNVFSIIVGYIAIGILYALQRPLSIPCEYLYERDRTYLKLFYEDFVYTITLIALVFLWRGAWNLNATYLIADPKIGGWVNHVGGTFGMMLFQIFSFVAAVGCGLDGFDPKSEAIFSINYLRAIFADRIREEGFIESNGNPKPKPRRGQSGIKLIRMNSTEDTTEDTALSINNNEEVNDLYDNVRVRQGIV